MNKRSIFFEEPDSVSEHKCEICEAICDVTRKVNGPTSFVAALAKTKRTHDYFRCPRIEESWHKQAEALICDISSCNSPSIKTIMEIDLKKIMKKRRINEISTSFKRKKS